MKRGFAKLPRQRAFAWSSVSFYCRALGSEIFRLFQEEEAELGAGDWRVALCRALEVDGRERRNVHRALDTLREAGLLVVGETTVRLLYQEATVAAHRSSTRPPLDLHPTSTEPPLDLHSTSTRPPLDLQIESTVGNHSDHPPEEREKEREKDRRIVVFWTASSVARAWNAAAAKLTGCPELHPEEEHRIGFANLAGRFNTGWTDAQASRLLEWYWRAGGWADRNRGAVVPGSLHNNWARCVAESKARDGAVQDARERARLQQELEQLRAQLADGLQVGQQIRIVKRRLAACGEAVG